MQGAKGFTLIELLVVVAIISVLASIAIPHYYGAIVRAKTARTVEDMSYVGRLLVAYNMDAGSLPEDSADDPFAPLAVLTTPRGYANDLPMDTYRVTDDPDYGKTFFYGVRDGHYATVLAESARNHGVPAYEFALASYGPDASFGRGAEVDTMAYDATNGTISRGNIWHFGP